MAFFKTIALSHVAVVSYFMLVMPAAFARSVFLNGVDVSSSRSQELRNVQIRINEKGDIFISAPHYQVTEEDFFTPLSRVPANGTTTVAAGGPGNSNPASGSHSPGAVTADAPAVAEPAVSKPASQPAPAKTSPATPVDKSGSFSNIGMEKPAPESMPPVLPATPPAK
jgi:hypothetical protein